MKKEVVWPTQMRPRDFDRRAAQILQEAQKTLLPDHAADIVAMNVETGEYVSAATQDEARKAFQKRWPNQLYYMVRADGGPVAKFHGM